MSSAAVLAVDTRAPAAVSGALLLDVQQLAKRYGGLVATDSVSLHVVPGEIHALIGPNGAGKSTLIALLSGELAADAGNICFDGYDITRWPTHRRARAGLARSYQITSVLPDFTALANVALAVQAQRGHSFRFWQPLLTAGGVTAAARAALDRVGLSQRATTLASALAHGEQRQLEIAMALAGGPKLLLLDEPMAGMGPHESACLVELLQQLKRHYTIVLVEHDMDAVFALADRISVLVGGRIIACGTPAQIRADARVRAAYLGADAAEDLRGEAAP
jgi:branched-chain amino acid transport system ATP-binding protein